MILSSEVPVAAGSKRLCFVHPDDPNLMVKVSRPDATPEDLRRKATSLRRRLLPASYLDEQRRELQAYRRLQARHGDIAWQHIPEFIGRVETDLGVGIVTRFIRNADGSAGINLTRFFPDGYAGEVDEAVRVLTDFVLALRLVPRDFKAYNVVIARLPDGRPHAWFVDGFGGSQFLPLADWNRAYGERMSRRRIDRFRANLENRVKNPDSQRLYPLTRDV